MPLSALFDGTVYDAILPRERVRTVDWAQENVPAPAPIAGNINFELFPYMIEPVDCMDDPEYSKVTVQAAARAGKTVGAQLVVLRIVRHDPHRIGWCEPDEPSCRRVLGRTWEMADGCADLADKLPPRRLRSMKAMRFTDCVVEGAWSGSASTGADTSWFLLVKNEASKFSRRKSRGDDGEDIGEADFFDYVDERVVGQIGATIVELSTPTVAGYCRIDASRRAGDNRAYFVPCPHCNHFQTLRSGDGKQPGGLRWEKNKAGKSEPKRARETAWYECEKCGRKILDEHRFEMMNAGQYVKEGQMIDKRGRIRGRPLRPGSHASFGPIGRHYSLLPGITWGSLAELYVKAKRDPSGIKWRSYLNAVDALVYDPKPVRVEPHELAGRLRGDTLRQEVPKWAAFCVLAADVGAFGVDDFAFYWMVIAFGPIDAPQFRSVPARRGQVIDWGITEGMQKFEDLLPTLRFDHAGGGSMGWSIGGVDTGWQGKGTEDHAIYDLCDRTRNLFPLKADSNGSAAGDWYRWGLKRADTPKAVQTLKRNVGIGDLLLVSTPRTQGFRSNLVSGRLKPDAEDWIGLPIDVCDQPKRHGGLFAELSADQLVGNKWERFGRPNEFGDTLRYCKALGELFVQMYGGKRWNKLKRAGQSRRRRKSKKVTAMNDTSARFRVGVGST